jgi:hypothetical protein
MIRRIIHFLWIMWVIARESFCHPFSNSQIDYETGEVTRTP